MSPYDVIVVGARCAGAPLAMLLARTGHSVLLLDRASFPSDTLSTHWILRPGVELLASWGLEDRLAATGCPPIDQLRVDFGSTVLSGTPTAANGPATTYAPRRSVLDALLVDAAREAGAEVREGSSVRDVVWENGVVAGVRGQDARGVPFAERARLVVGADGRGSTIARAVGAPVTKDRGPLAATLYGYWSHVPADGAETFVRPGLGASLWPTHDGLTVVALTLPRTDFLAHRSGSERLYLDTLDRLPELRARMHGGRLAEPVRAAGLLRNFFRLPHGPGWALAGDAGQHKDPIGAHGISDAFTDADSLARAIGQEFSGALAPGRSLARYAARRDAGRAAMFEFVCRQAELQPLDEDFTRVLRASAEDPRLRGELLDVFAGSRRVEELFRLARAGRPDQ
ncbi:NAD(P)/FAD-dependent oxidoreductase [Streptomyces sp. MB09-01]|uniref:NAD(P)/FAD-dependent oxidoreductase n=1 Tax=Streptomyces sp. MB09-01 TaxID=3028666 RepID=UPI0029A7327D|nr:NAD(P)/FAD-dependent oxidoreductase [Streptomyces sp. MB09-01]MDX3536038.1 NAD(P)/FAD-dependent oxidoreductase [Streptomyces sp. MB09-01]